MLLEICISSVEDAFVAKAGGADRLELNSALPLGGLTPSYGSYCEIKMSVDLPIMVMVRPRTAGFAYSKSEFRVMLRDRDLFLQENADGIVGGILHADGTVDRQRCQEFFQPIIDAGKDAVFHRAFDVTSQPFQALEMLIDLGLNRILTSGQESTAYNGSATIGKLNRQADGRLAILPGAGINRFTLYDVLNRTGCHEVHASLRQEIADTSTQHNSKISFGGNQRENQYSQTSPTLVAELRALLDSYSPS